MIIYHASCADGFAAAWIARRDRGTAVMVPAQYGDPPPDVRGRDVLIVDFSYPRDVLLAMDDAASSLRVFDHHKTSQEDLRGLDFATFDMNRSGAGLTWDELNPGKPRPLLVDYVEDRDLWRWALPNSREINAAMASHPMSFGLWERWAQAPELRRLAEEGAAILRYQEQLVGRHVERAELVCIDGRQVPCVCATVLQSEIGNVLALNAHFAAMWRAVPGGFVYSLRSIEGRADVGEIATRFGGGGHARAAGFKVTELIE